MIARRQLSMVLTAAIAAGGAGAALGSDESDRVQPTEKLLKHTQTAAAARPYDEPDAAMDYALLKRQGLLPGETAFDRYSIARQQMQHMPTHSAKLGGLIPPATALSPVATLQIETLKALATWESLGPGNIGGRIRAFVIQPNRPQTMYAGGVSGGIWKTVDGGQHWTPIGDEMANIAVNCLVMHPEDPATLYAGTGEGYFREEVRGTWLPLRGAGIFKTSDGGTTWQRLVATETEDFRWVNDLVISPRNPDRVYAATGSGVWRSSSGGETWAVVHEPTVKGGCLDLEQRTDTATDWLFAACGTLDQASVWRTTDAGSDEPWQNVLSENGMGRTSLAIAPSDQEVIYALAASNLAGPGGHFDQGLLAVFRSTREGDPGSWTARVRNTDPEKLNTLLLANPAAASYLDCGWSDSNRWVNMGWYANVIAVDPMDPDIVWAAGVDLLRSDDGGRNWGMASHWWLDTYYSVFVHADQHAIVFHPDYDGTSNWTVFATGDGGIFRSAYARSPVGYGTEAICDPFQTSMRWTNLNHNLGVTQFYHGAPYPNGARYLGGTQDNGTIRGSDNTGGDGWYSVFGGDGGYVAVDPDDTNVLYIEYQWARIQKSVNGGWNFQPATHGISSPSSDFLFITPFIMDPNDPLRLWTGGRRLWRSDNGAGWWDAASTTLANGAKVSALAVAPGDPDTVLAGTTDGSIYRSTEARAAGQTTVWQAPRPRDGYVSWLAFDPANASVVYATYAGFGGAHVWRSSDGGITWISVDGSGNTAIPDIPVHSIVVDPAMPSRLFLGTDLGVFTSLNSGASWAVENTGFANVVTESLALSGDDGSERQLYAFTHGRGAWRVGIEAPPPGPRRGSDGRIRP